MKQNKITLQHFNGTNFGGKLVTSKNPLKKRIVSTLKAATGCDKVTLVLETKDYYSGHCQKHIGNKKYESIGIKYFRKDDIK